MLSGQRRRCYAEHAAYWNIHAILRSSLRRRATRRRQKASASSDPWALRLRGSLASHTWRFELRPLEATLCLAPTDPRLLTPDVRGEGPQVPMRNAPGGPA